MTSGKAAWTCPLARAQVDACKCIAVRMHEYALKDKIIADSRQINFAETCLNFPPPEKKISVYATLKRCNANAHESVEAAFNTCNAPSITVKVPSNTSYSTKPPDYTLVHTVIAGALAHELVHAAQYWHKKRRYNHGLEATAWTKDPREVENADPQTWLGEYYKVPAEFEAHAVQAAAEVYFSNPSITDEGAFPTEFQNTPLFARISARVGVGGDASDWWSCFQAAAWAAYRSWVTP